MTTTGSPIPALVSGKLLGSADGSINVLLADGSIAVVPIGAYEALILQDALDAGSAAALELALAA